MADKEITFSWTETRKVQDVAVPLQVLVDLMMEHAPDDLASAVAEVLAEKGRTEIDQYEPIFAALRVLAEEQEATIEYTDFNDITHDA